MYNTSYNNSHFVLLPTLSPVLMNQKKPCLVFAKQYHFTVSLLQKHTAALQNKYDFNITTPMNSPYKSY